MPVRMRILIAGAGSAALLLGALGFQYIGGLAPCHLCILQRWPHLAAAVLAVLGVTLLGGWARAVAVLGAVAMLVDTGLGIYHTGVEQHWWLGPASCTSGDISGMSADQLMAHIMSAPLVQCDQIAWQFLGLSMASWNAVFSFLLALIWASVALKKA